MTKVFDPIRKKWVVLTPEEKVRQALLHRLLHSGYPKSSLIVEVDISRLYPKEHLPLRRVDILCGRFHEGSFLPLILSECKQGKWRQDAVRQVEGYCALLRCPFFLLADSEKSETYMIDEKNGAEKIGSILSYKALIEVIKETMHARSASSSKKAF